MHVFDAPQGSCKVRLAVFWIVGLVTAVESAAIARVSRHVFSPAPILYDLQNKNKSE